MGQTNWLSIYAPSSQSYLGTYRIRTQEGSAAVLPSFLDRFPGDRYKRPLEEGVVYDILFVIFAGNDPVPGVNLVSPEIGNDPAIVGALTRFDQ
jgi:hypothetical protein